MYGTIIIVALAVIALFTAYFLLIGNIDTSAPKIVKLEDPILLIGLEIYTSDKAIYKDVGKVAADFNTLKEKHPIPHLKEPWASVFVSKNYERENRTFTYIAGDVVTRVEMIPDGLRSYEIPALTYAVFRIQPRSRIAWGITMGRMKRYIFTQWLPSSGYEPSELIGDFEWHDDRSLGRRPEIQLYVALKEK